MGSRRVYVTTAAQNYNPEVGSTVSSLATILANEIECYSFTILTKDKDVLFAANNFQGHVDLFVAALYQPSSTTSSSVKLFSKRYAPNHMIIVRALDRQYWNSVTGNYFLCGLAYTPTTAKLYGDELWLAQTLNSPNEVLYSFWLYEEDNMNFQFTAEELRQNNLTIHVDLGIYNTQGDPNTVRDTTLLQ